MKKKKLRSNANSTIKMILLGHVDLNEKSLFSFQGILTYSKEIHINIYISQLYPCKKSYVYIFNSLEVFP